MLLVVLMLAGLSVRLPGIDQSIVRFHPTRHYRSAVLARACYYDHTTARPEWAQRVADANREMQQAGEPPVMEWLACGAYLLAGREDVMIPRVAAVIIWVSGAIPLWLLTRRLASPALAPVAVTLYLFLPYGIVASRNFQPDQLMTVASLWAIHALVRHHDLRRRNTLFAAAALIGVAGLIKPMSVFLTAPVALVTAGRFSVLALGMLAPLLYYGYEAVAGSLVRDQMRMRFEPHMIATAFFWEGLAKMVSRVETLPLFALALSATVFAPDRIARRILAALFAGYLAFAVVFTYHMPTHDYYHLPYLAVVALGVAMLLCRAGKLLRPPMVYGACAVIAIAGSISVWPQLKLNDAPTLSRIYQEIGDLASHDTKALFLDTEYGFALMYHGELSGDSWPNQDDLAAEAFDGRPAVDAETRFDRDYADWKPTYLIATDLASFEASPDLQRLLDRRATPVRITNLYRVYRFHP
ncbi:MAG TPA: glycosyltransferase family 39 protein [Vicinamibacterales bacterium]|nr:glycosyltransferase family 39 protein [Vicinamibacterales bacterium]